MKRPVRIGCCLLLWCMVTLSAQTITAQCPGGQTPQTLTYDTSVSGPGSGIYDFTFPKFPSALGTLMSVTLHSDVTVKYTYSLFNATTGGLDRTRMIRTDDIYGSALAPTTISATNTEPWHNINVPANTLIVHGPLGLSYSQNSVINDSRLFNFMGGGTVSLTYENSSTLSVNAPVGTQIQFVDNIDTTKFSLTYTYCQLIVTAANLRLLAATRKSASAAVLSFRNDNNTPGDVYTLEASLDGSVFKAAPATMTSFGSDFIFLCPQAPRDKFYLRVKQVSTSGQVSVSSVKTVAAIDDDSSDKNILIYPNPAQSHFSCILPPAEKGNWKLRIVGTAGNKVFEQQFSNTSSMNVFLNASVPDGLYFIEAINMQTGKRYTSKTSIRH